MTTLRPATLPPWPRGNPRQLEVRIVDAAGEPVPLNASTWTAQLRKSVNSVQAVTMTADTTDAADGVLRFTLTGDQTRAMAVGEFVGAVEGSLHGELLPFTGRVAQDVVRLDDEPTGGLADVLTVALTVDTIEVTAQSVAAITLEGGPGGGDQTAAEVDFTPAGTLVATDVQAALEELDDDQVAEAAVRAAADTALADALTTEQTARAAGDAAAVATAAAAAQALVDAEAAAREAGDEDLDGRLAVIEALGSLATDAELIATVASILGTADADGDTLGELQALITARLLKSANLSDLPSPSTARTNLGLGNVNNTSDADKPVSTATQTALNLKANTADLGAYQPLDSDLTALAAANNSATLSATTAAFTTAKDTRLTTAATTASEVVGKFTGTPDGTKFLRDDGSLAAASGGGSLPLVQPRSMQSTVYTPLFPSTATGAQGFVRGYYQAYPFVAYKTITLDRLGIEVTTAVASVSIRLGIYADDGTGYPGSLLVDPTATTALDASTTGNKSVVLSQSLTAGTLYWIALLTHGGASNPSLRMCTPTWGTVSIAGRSETEAANGTARNAWTGSNGSAVALPATFQTTREPGTLTSGMIPNIYGRAT